MDLLTSKRVHVTIVGGVIWLALRFGFKLDPGGVDHLLDLAIALVLSFGATGWGKEKSKQEIEAAKAGVSVATIDITTTMPPPVPLTAALVVREPEDISTVARVLRDQAKQRTPPSPEK